MASAVLAGRRGTHHPWGENRAPMTLLAAPAPNPIPNRHALPRADSSRSKAPPPPPLATPAPSYLTFRPTGLSHREAALLRERLNDELGQVRALLSRIDTWQPKLPKPPAKLRAAMRKRCAQVLARLQKDKRSVWFNAPVEVEALGLHDYHAVISRPMDLGTVRAGLAAYPSHDAFAADVRLTFANALQYNPVGHDVHTFAADLLASFEKMYGEAVSWFEQECKRLAPPPKPAKVEPPAPAAPAPAKPKVVKMRKPKAREQNKRAMSLEEKNLLRVGLEGLPEEKMHNVLQIVRKRSVNNPELLGDEIELDIDEMDIETQWELDRFVNNFNKALNKSRRAAMVNGDIAEVGDTANGALPTLVDNADMESENPYTDKTTVVAEQMDEYVDIEDEMPMATYQSVEIEKGSEVVTVAGGSGSGSSSSSGSSGGSASEAGNARSLM